MAPVQPVGMTPTQPAPLDDAGAMAALDRAAAHCGQPHPYDCTICEGIRAATRHLAVALAVRDEALKFAISDRDANLDRAIKAEKNEQRYLTLRDHLEVTRNEAVPNCISMAYIRTDRRARTKNGLIDAAVDDMGKRRGR